MLSPQLSLWVSRYDPVQRKEVDHPGWKHVVVLWRMDRDRRLLVWEALGRHDTLEVLELGDSDTLDVDDQLQVLARRVLPPRLDGMCVLTLRSMPKLTDAGLQALAAAGCGTHLTSLTLRCACLFFLLFFPPLQKKEQRTAQG